VVGGSIGQVVVAGGIAGGVDKFPVIQNRENSHGMVKGVAGVVWQLHVLGHGVELEQGIQHPPVCKN